jgi:hypothetical protein
VKATGPGEAAAKPFAQVIAKTGSECPQLPKLMAQAVLTGRASWFLRSTTLRQRG